VFVHGFLDLLLDGRVDLVGSQCLVDQQLHEVVQALVPLSGQGHFAGLLCIVDGLELLDVVCELILEAFEALHGIESLDCLVHLAPSQRVHEWRVFGDLHFLGEASQQLLEMVGVDLLVLQLEFDGHVEAEEQFIFVE